MKKKLYFVVAKETAIINEVHETTGYKTISIYEIANNEPKMLFQFNRTNDTNTNDEIINYLEDNGYCESVKKEVELIQL